MLCFGQKEDCSPGDSTSGSSERLLQRGGGKVNKHVILVKGCAQLLNCVRFFLAPWIVTCQAPLCLEFSKQWSGLPFPTPGYLPYPGVEPAFLVSPAFFGRFFTTEPPGKLLGEGGVPANKHIFLQKVSAIMRHSHHCEQF